MDYLDDLARRAERHLLHPEIRRGIAQALDDAYGEARLASAGVDPELQSRLFGTQLWAQSQTQLRAMARSLEGRQVRADYRIVASCGFPYLAIAFGHDLLVTLKKAETPSQVVRGSFYRRRLANVHQAPLFGEGSYGVVEAGASNTVYAVLQFGPSADCEDRFSLGYVSAGIPDPGFHQYVHTVQIFGNGDESLLEPEVGTEIREDAMGWLEGLSLKKRG